MMRLHRAGRRSARALEERFAHGDARRDSTATRDLERVGIANQTTMLAGESLAIAAEFRRSHGAALRRRRRRPSGSAPSTPSAPPPRSGRTRWWQLLEEPLDLMLVVGGYNSSNTTHLAALAASHGVPDLPHRGRGRDRPRGRDDPPPAGRDEARGDRRPDWLGGGSDHRHHRRRVDTQQQDRRDRRAHLPHGRGRPGSRGRVARCRRFARPRSPASPRSPFGATSWKWSWCRRWA